MGTVLGVDLAARFDRVRIVGGLREQTHTDTLAGTVTVATTARHITLHRERLVWGWEREENEESKTKNKNKNTNIELKSG